VAPEQGRVAGRVAGIDGEDDPSGFEPGIEEVESRWVSLSIPRE